MENISTILIESGYNHSGLLVTLKITKNTLQIQSIERKHIKSNHKQTKKKR